MTVERDKIIVDIDMKADPVKATQVAFTELVKSVKVFQTALKTSVEEGLVRSLKGARKELREFQRDLSMISKGDAPTQAINAQIMRASAELKAQTRSMKAVLANIEMSSVTETARGYQNLQKLQNLKQLTGGVNNDAAIAAAVENMRRKDTLQNAIAGVQDRSGSKEFLAAQRKLREESLFGDGGASMFRIQARLLAQGAILYKTVQTISAGADAVIDFDQSMKDLQAITESTDEEMMGLSESIKAVASGSKFAAKEVAATAKILAQAGFSSKDIGSALPGVTNLATATGTDLSSAVDVATSAKSIFKIDPSDMGRVADSITKALNVSKLNIEQVALALQYFGNTAATANLDLEETLALIASMADVGIRSGSTLGTGLSALVTELIAPSKKLTEALHSVGLTIQEVDPLSNDLIDILAKLSKSGFDVGDAFENMEVRTARALVALLANGPEYIRGREKEIRDSTGAAQKAADIQMEGFRNSMMALGNEMKLLAIDVFTPLLQETEKWVDKLQAAVALAREYAAEIREVLKFMIDPAGYTGRFIGGKINSGAKGLVNAIADPPSVNWMPLIDRVNPVYGPENQPIYGPENQPMYGPDSSLFNPPGKPARKATPAKTKKGAEPKSVYDQSLRVPAFDDIDKFNKFADNEVQFTSFRQGLMETAAEYRDLMEAQQSWTYNLREDVHSALETTREGFKTFVRDLVTGNETISGSFKKMATSIIESMLEMSLNKLSSGIMDVGLGFLGDLFGGATGMANPNIPGTTYMMNGGGIVKANSGAYIGRDNQLVMAQEGEGILRRGAMELLGRDNFSQLNAMGNRQISAASANMTGYNQPAAGGPVVTNVYVVSPDQKPSLTKNDVVVIITEDLAKGGNTKKLVKSIVSGQT